MNINSSFVDTQRIDINDYENHSQTRDLEAQFNVCNENNDSLDEVFIFVKNENAKQGIYSNDTNKE